jgi:hypothetical protein
MSGSTLYDTVPLLSIVAAIVAGVWLLCASRRLKWTARCAATSYSDILRAQGWGDRRTLAGGSRKGWINLYRIFRPDIVVADYSSTANPFFNSVIEQLVGLARSPCRSRDLHAARIAP